MQHAFPEWYRHGEEALRAVLEGGVIALDANVLHHLYRLGDRQRKQVLEVLGNDAVRDRLWIPYQVGLEYHRNRLKNAYDQSRMYAGLIDELSKHGRQLRAKFQESIFDPNVRQIPVAKLDNFIEILTNDLAELSKRHVIDFDTVSNEDPVRAALDALFSELGKVGERPKAEILQSRVAESVKRYARKVPPGYKDAEGPNKKENPEGDYLIWCELLDLAEVVDKPILFVTNDEKADWYQLGPDDKVLGPRPELRREMAMRTTHPYHQTTLTGFLRLSERFLSISVDEATINQVDATSHVSVSSVSMAEEAYRYENSVVSAIRRIAGDLEIVNNYSLGQHGIDFSLMSNSRPVAEVIVKWTRSSIGPELVGQIMREAAAAQRSVPLLVIVNRFYSIPATGVSVPSVIEIGPETHAIVIAWMSEEDDDILRDAIQVLRDRGFNNPRFALLRYSTSRDS